MAGVKLRSVNILKKQQIIAKEGDGRENYDCFRKTRVLCMRLSGWCQRSPVQGEHGRDEIAYRVRAEVDGGVRDLFDAPCSILCLIGAMIYTCWRYFISTNTSFGLVWLEPKALYTRTSFSSSTTTFDTAP